MSAMTSRLPSLQSLRVFEACARHANFTRAAAELGVTPTAVSLRVRDLEIELGVALFERRGPKVRPTAEGDALARRMSVILADVREAVDACRAVAASIRVTVLPTLAALWLTPRLARYQARPGAARIRLDVSTEIRPSADFDVAIRSGSADWPLTKTTILFPTEGTPMLSPALGASSGIVSPADLTRLPLIADERWSRWFDEAGVGSVSQGASYGVDYPTQELAATAVAGGAGVALLSPTVFAPMLADGRLIQPFSHVIRGPGAYCAVVARHERRLVVLDFVAWLAAEAALEFAWPVEEMP